MSSSSSIRVKVEKSGLRVFSRKNTIEQRNVPLDARIIGVERNVTFRCSPICVSSQARSFRLPYLSMLACGKRNALTRRKISELGQSWRY